MEDQTPVLVFAGVGARHAVVAALDGLQQLREKKTLAAIREEGVEGAVPEGEAAVATIQVICNVRDKLQHIIVNSASVGENTGLVAGPWFRYAVLTDLLKIEDK